MPHVARTLQAPSCACRRYQIDLAARQEHALNSSGRRLFTTQIKREQVVEGPAQWYFMGATEEWKLYDQTSNQTIETAHSNGQAEVIISGGLLAGIEASKFELFGEDVVLDAPVLGDLPSAEWQPKEPWLQRAPRRVRLASRGANTACC